MEEAYSMGRSNASRLFSRERVAQMTVTCGDFWQVEIVHHLWKRENLQLELY